MAQRNPAYMTYDEFLDWADEDTVGRRLASL